MTNQEVADELQYAIDLIKQDGKDWLDERDIPILEAAISALQEQEAKQEAKKSRCTYKPDCPWYDGSKCNSPNDHGYHECDYDRGIFPESYQEKIKNSNKSSLTQKEADTITKQASCDYCHEDSDGYVTPLEKNCHAFVRRSPIDGWVLSMKYGAWRKDISIRFCPICGRELKHE